MQTLAPAPIRLPVVDDRGMMTNAWASWARSLYMRVGGPLAETNNELGDAAGQAPPPAAGQTADDWLTPAAASDPPVDLDIENRIAAMAEEIALLRTQIEDLRQGTIA